MDRKCQPSLPVQKRLMGYCHHPAGWVGNMDSQVSEWDEFSESLVNMIRR